MTASYNTIIVVGGSAGTHSILIAEPVSSVASRSIGFCRFRRLFRTTRSARISARRAASLLLGRSLISSAPRRSDKTGKTIKKATPLALLARELAGYWRAYRLAKSARTISAWSRLVRPPRLKARNRFSKSLMSVVPWPVHASKRVEHPIRYLGLGRLRLWLGLCRLPPIVDLLLAQHAADGL
jgi:hypothetical protein